MVTEAQPAGAAPGGGALPLLRLLQLVSPTLPTGAFSYSQGLEWAVECGWVRDRETFADWLSGLLREGLSYLELPLLIRLYRACADEDDAAIRHWSDWLYASRETHELRTEERNRARALTALITGLEIPHATGCADALRRCQLTSFAYAAVHWQVALKDCVLGFAWSWLENQVAAGVKLIPLGQTHGQRLQLRLAEQVVAAVDCAWTLTDEDIGAAAPTQAIASARHETQYSRLFRS